MLKTKEHLSDPQSLKWKFEFTGLNKILYLYIVLNKNWKIYWSKQSFTGHRLEDRCSSWGLDPMYHPTYNIISLGASNPGYTLTIIWQQTKRMRLYKNLIIKVFKLEIQAAALLFIRQCPLYFNKKVVLPEEIKKYKCISFAIL